METQCNYLVCAPCFCTWLSSTAVGVPSCPACSTELATNSAIHQVPPVVQDILTELQLHCDNFASGRPAIISLGWLCEHVAQCHPPFSQSQSQSVVSSSSLPPTPPRPLQAPNTHTPLTPSKISAILDRPVETPLSGAERKAVTHLVKCALHVGTSESTGGGNSQLI